MKHSFAKLFALAGLSLVSAGVWGQTAPKLVVAYVQNWNDPATYLSSIDFTKITHLNLAFENPIDDDGDLSCNINDDTLIQKARANNVKVLVSIGGGGVADQKDLMDRYFALESDAKRAGFVAKLANYVITRNLDGLDVDLEGPAIGKDYGKFVDDLSKALLPAGKLLTCAVSEGYGGDQIPNSAFADFSFVNLMCYDATGPWDPKRPGQHSSMDLVKQNVAYWLKRGLPKSKTVVGVPFYGYGFGPAFTKGGYTYLQIVNQFPGAETADQIGNTVWYNGIPTIKAKAKYVVDQGLAGVMIWSIDQDAPGDKSLLSALYAGLHP